MTDEPSTSHLGSRRPSHGDASYNGGSRRPSQQHGDASLSEFMVAMSSAESLLAQGSDILKHISSSFKHYAGPMGSRESSFGRSGSPQKGSGALVPRTMENHPLTPKSNALVNQMPGRGFTKTGPASGAGVTRPGMRSVVPIWERLRRKADESSTKRNQMHDLVVRQKAEEEMRECTFRPGRAAALAAGNNPRSTTAPPGTRVTRTTLSGATSIHTRLYEDGVSKLKQRLQEKSTPSPSNVAAQHARMRAHSAASRGGANVSHVVRSDGTPIWQRLFSQAKTAIEKEKEIKQRQQHYDNQFNGHGTYGSHRLTNQSSGSHQSTVTDRKFTATTVARLYDSEKVRKEHLEERRRKQKEEADAKIERDKEEFAKVWKRPVRGMQHLQAASSIPILQGRRSPGRQHVFDTVHDVPHTNTAHSKRSDGSSPVFTPSSYRDPVVPAAAAAAGKRKPMTEEDDLLTPNGTYKPSAAGQLDGLSSAPPPARSRTPTPVATPVGTPHKPIVSKGSATDPLGRRVQTPPPSPTSPPPSSQFHATKTSNNHLASNSLIPTLSSNTTGVESAAGSPVYLGTPPVAPQQHPRPLSKDTSNNSGMYSFKRVNSETVHSEKLTPHSTGLLTPASSTGGVHRKRSLKNILENAAEMNGISSDAGPTTNETAADNTPAERFDSLLSGGSSDRPQQAASSPTPSFVPRLNLPNGGGSGAEASTSGVAAEKQYIPSYQEEFEKAEEGGFDSEEEYETAL